MSKVDTELVKNVLQRNELDIRLVSQIMEDISNEMAAGDDEDKVPAVKKQFAILVSDPPHDFYLTSNKNK